MTGNPLNHRALQDASLPQVCPPQTFLQGLPRGVQNIIKSTCLEEVNFHLFIKSSYTGENSLKSQQNNNAIFFAHPGGFMVGFEAHLSDQYQKGIKHHWEPILH